MTSPMYTDKDYLDQRFTTLENMFEDMRGDVSGIDRKLDDMQAQISDNKLDQVKAGTFATFTAAIGLAIAEFMRRASGS